MQEAWLHEAIGTSETEQYVPDFHLNFGVASRVKLEVNNHCCQPCRRLSHMPTPNFEYGERTFVSGSLTCEQDSSTGGRYEMPSPISSCQTSPTSVTTSPRSYVKKETRVSYQADMYHCMPDIRRIRN
ncbi:PREDICTED: uncharacterized protein LOC106820232 [Priapulus caudatus]|uniref:Uncharacterized protein LOC106820232 n=1 Tax=Priapulus caudatus TaxID=37621 RepID=A0ABM1F735_PRICU|nr:PREDICTED: uncharacterized protein LOC106820232 [Priapulus caudatus]